MDRLVLGRRPVNSCSRCVLRERRSTRNTHAIPTQTDGSPIAVPIEADHAPRAYPPESVLRSCGGREQEAELGLEELLTAWLGEDRENWPVYRLTLIDPWQERPGIWSEQTPAWVRTLGAAAATAHAPDDASGPPPTG